MQAPSRDCSAREVFKALTNIAPGLPSDQLVAVALHVLNTGATRSDPLADLPELHRQLAESMKVSHHNISARLENMQPQEPLPAESRSEAQQQACLSLLDSKVQLLFELWDRDGDGSLGFAEVALAFRKFCPAMQHLQGTAADAAEALFLYGDGKLCLDRLQFSHLLRGLCEAVNLGQEAMLDLLIVLAAVDDRPADEMTLLLAESALQQKFAERQSHGEDATNTSLAATAAATS